MTNPDRNIESEEETVDHNQLNALGNRAIALGLIIGHGYHQGQYELLYKEPGTSLLLSPQEAFIHLKALLRSVEETDG